MTDNKPMAKFKAGQVETAVWRNDITVAGQDRTILKASVSRRYRDAQGQWKSSTSFSRNEIPLAIHCLQQAFEYILANPPEQDESGDEGE